MGRQVNFHAIPADVAALEATITKVEPMLILHVRSPTAEPRVVSSLHIEENGKPWLFYYLIRESDLKSIIMQHIAEEHWRVDYLRSPAIEFTSCYFDGKILRRGRLYYVGGFYGEDDAWVEKPADFRRWGDKVLKATKKFLQRHEGDYIGQDALNWVQRDNGQLVT